MVASASHCAPRHNIAGQRPLCFAVVLMHSAAQTDDRTRSSRCVASVAGTNWFLHHAEYEKRKECAGAVERADRPHRGCDGVRPAPLRRDIRVAFVTFVIAHSSTRVVDDLGAGGGDRRKYHDSARVNASADTFHNRFTRCVHLSSARLGCGKPNICVDSHSDAAGHRTWSRRRLRRCVRRELARALRREISRIGVVPLPALVARSAGRGRAQRRRRSTGYRRVAGWPRRCGTRLRARAHGARDVQPGRPTVRGVPVRGNRAGQRQRRL